MSSRKNTSLFQILKVDLASSIYIYIAFIILISNIAFIEGDNAIMSALIAQEYFPVTSKAYISDGNMFIFSFIAWINQCFPGVQLYAYYLYTSIFIAGLVFLKIIKETSYHNDTKKNLISFVFIVIQIPNLLFLHHTHLSILLIAVFFFYYHKRTKSIFFYCLLFIYCFITRVDTTVWLSLLYLIFCLSKKKKKINLFDALPAISSLLLLASYNFYVFVVEDDIYKIFYFYELDLIDKDNINYSGINSIQLYVINLLKSFGIQSEEFTNIAFVKNILNTDYNNFFNGLLNPRLILNTIQLSLVELLASIEVISVAIILSIIFIIQKNKKYVNIILILFPLSACIYIYLPTHFLYPYYSILILFLSAQLIRSSMNKKIYNLIVLTIVISIFSFTARRYYVFIQKNNTFLNTINSIHVFQKTLGEPIYISNMYQPHRFFSPKINYRYENNQVIFMNFLYWNHYTNYDSKWRDLGCKNSLSLIDKLQCIETNNASLIIDNQQTEKAYEKLLKLKGRNDIHPNFIIWDDYLTQIKH